MSFAHFAPTWFFGYDIALELIFAIVSLVVSIFAFKIYKATDQKPVKLFGTSFLFISLSYFMQSLFNFLIISKLNEQVCVIVKMQSVYLFDTIGMFTHMIFMIVGLVILTYMSFKSEKKSLLMLLLVISLLSIFLSRNKLYMFFLFSSIYLIFIAWHFISNYLRNKQKKTLLIAIAFLFILFGNIHFLFSVSHQLMYAIGHILELLAYLLILWNFYLVLKK